MLWPLSLVEKARNRRKVVASTVRPHEAVYAPTVDRQTAKELLTRNVGWVYTFAKRNATDVGSIPIRVYTRDSSVARKVWGGRPVGMKRNAGLRRYGGHMATKAMSYDDAPVEIQHPEHPVCALFRTPNPWTTGTEMVELLVTYLELTGNAYWHKVIGANGWPTEVWTLGSQFVRVLPSDDPLKFIDGYEYGRGQEILDDFSAEEVVHFRYPNPHSPYVGMGPLQAVVAEADTSRRITMHSYFTLEQGAQPGLVIALKGNTTKETRQEIEATLNRKHSGVWKAGRSMVLGADATVLQWGMSDKELAYLGSSESVRDTLAAAFDISKSDITSDDVNRANAEAGANRQERRAVRPRLQKIENALNQFLMPAFREAMGDPGLFVCFDPPEMEAEADAVTRVVALRGAGIITLNEAREELMYEPVDGGDEIGPEAEDDGSSGGGDVESGDDEEDDRSGDDGSRPSRSKAIGGVPDLQGDPEAGHRTYHRGVHPAYAEKAACGGFLGLTKELTPDESNLKRLLQDAYERAAEEAKKAATDPTTLSLGKFRDDVFDALTRELGRMFTAAILSGAAQGGASFDVVPEFQLQFLKGYTIRVANEITARTEEALRDAIKAGIVAGESEPAIIERIGKVLGEESGFRAERIARTEMAYVRGEGERRGAKIAGFHGKTWDLSAGSCLFCQAIKARHPGVIPIDQPFAKIGETLIAPDGSVFVVTREVQVPPLHIQCQCAAMFREQAA